MENQHKVCSISSLLSHTVQSVDPQKKVASSHSTVQNQPVASFVPSLHCSGSLSPTLSLHKSKY